MRINIINLLYLLELYASGVILTILLSEIILNDIRLIIWQHCYISFLSQFLTDMNFSKIFLLDLLITNTNFLWSFELNILGKSIYIIQHHLFRQFFFFLCIHNLKEKVTGIGLEKYKFNKIRYVERIINISFTKIDTENFLLFCAQKKKTKKSLIRFSFFFEKKTLDS